MLPKLGGDLPGYIPPGGCSMLNRNSQSDELVQEPSDINLAIRFGDDHDLITLLGVHPPELDDKPVVRVHLLVHIV